MRAYRGNRRKREGPSGAGPRGRINRTRRFSAARVDLRHAFWHDRLRVVGWVVVGGTAIRGVRGGGMFGLLGLMGILAAGLLGDAVLTQVDDDDDAPPEDDSTSDDADDLVNSVLLDTTGADTAAVRTGAGDGMPQSDDIPDAPDDPLRLTGGAGADILNGAGANDTLAGHNGDDMIGGAGGADRIDGGAGDDAMDGGTGNDMMRGGVGHDSLTAGDGNDRLFGAGGHDHLAGQGGNDLLNGAGGNDTLLGGDGDDTERGGFGDDWLLGGAGNDDLMGIKGQDTLDGGAGNDTLWGQMPDHDDGMVDFLNAGAGDDALHLGAGDYGTGGAGADSFLIGQAGGHPTMIMDYSASEDSLIVEFDPTAHPNPVVSVNPIVGTDDGMIQLDGIDLARVQGGATLDPAMIMLRPA